MQVFAFSIDQYQHFCILYVSTSNNVPSQSFWDVLFSFISLSIPTFPPTIPAIFLPLIFDVVSPVLMHFSSLRSHLIPPVKVKFLLLPPLLQDLYLQLLHELLLLVIQPNLLLELKSQHLVRILSLCGSVGTPDNHTDSSKKIKKHLAGSFFT